MTDIETYEFGNRITLEATFAAEPTPASVKVWIRNAASPVAVEHDATSLVGPTARYDVTLDQAGEWYYRFVSDVGEIESAFRVDPDQTRMPVIVEGDLFSLVPRIRRAVDGPGTSRLDHGVISDRGALELAADAVADLMLYTAGTGAFAYTLEVTARETLYNAPSQWKILPALTVPAEALVVAQAALNYFFHALRDLKVSETIRDEAGEWTYSRSANLLTKQMDLLAKLRDAALEALAAGNPAWDTYVSFLAVRDRTTAQLVEGWTVDGGVGGLELDPRFGTIG